MPGIIVGITLLSQGIQNNDGLHVQSDGLAEELYHGHMVSRPTGQCSVAIGLQCCTRKLHNGLVGGIETIFSEDGCIDIYSVIEDELILAIPLVALHEDTDCNRHWPAAGGAESESRHSPFEVLRQLKTTE